MGSSIFYQRRRYYNPFLKQLHIKLHLQPSYRWGRRVDLNRMNSRWEHMRHSQYSNGWIQLTTTSHDMGQCILLEKSLLDNISNAHWGWRAQIYCPVYYCVCKASPESQFILLYYPKGPRLEGKQHDKGEDIRISACPCLKLLFFFFFHLH